MNKKRGMTELSKETKKIKKSNVVKKINKIINKRNNKIIKEVEFLS